MKPGWLALCLLLAWAPAGATDAGPPGDRPGPTGAFAGRTTGLTSASDRDLDFRANGFALPMYLAFLPAAALFVAGLSLNVRRWGRRTGRPDIAGPTMRPAAVLSRLVSLGLLQKRLGARPSSAWIHLLIFWGFVVLTAGSFLIMIDSYVLGPLGASPSRGDGYRAFQGIMDAAGVALLFGVALALLRRARRRGEQGHDAPRTIVILVVLLILGVSGFVLEGLRIRLEGKAAEPWSFAGSAVSSMMGVASPESSLAHLLYDSLWWGHAALAFALIAAIPYSRLRHAVTSPINIAVSSPEPGAALSTPFNLKEIQSTGAFDIRVGAAALEDFSWRDRLALSACVDSGLCREVCPAYGSGTPLSPLRLMGRLRDAMETVRGDREDQPGLVDGLLTADEIWSCTMCGACARACPVLADPLRPIVEMRRGLVAANRAGRGRVELLDKLSRTGNPYGASREARERLPAEIGARTLREDPEVDLLYWIGCAATFDPRVRATVTAMVRLLNAAGVRFGMLGGEETCTGDPARRIGEEGLFQELAFRNIEMFERHRVRKILTHCAHCFNTFRNEYPALGPWRAEVVHHASFIRDLIEDGRIRPGPWSGAPMTVHDSCYAARFNRMIGAPRAALRAIPGAGLREMDHSGEDTLCCGGGGGQYWYQVPRREKMSERRLREAEKTGAGVVVSECPYCLKMLEDGLISSGLSAGMRARDIAEVVAESLGPSPGEETRP